MAFADCEGKNQNTNVKKILYCEREQSCLSLAVCEGKNKNIAVDKSIL